MIVNSLGWRIRRARSCGRRSREAGRSGGLAARTRRAEPVAWTGPSAKGMKQESPRVRSSAWPDAARRVQAPSRQSRMRGPVPGRASGGGRAGAGPGRASGGWPGEAGGRAGRGGTPGRGCRRWRGRPRGRGGEHGHGDRGVEEPEQFGHVDVLAGEAGADHVVGVGEQLDPGAAQVGVQAAGRHEHRLAGLQHLVPHQQQGEHAEVARMVGGDPDGRGAGVGVRAGRRRRAAGRRPRPRRRAAAGLGPFQDGRQRRAEGVLAGRIRQRRRPAARARPRPGHAAGRPRRPGCAGPPPPRTGSGRRGVRVWASRPRSSWPGSPRARPRAFSAANPASACAREGCTWIDSAFSADSTLSRNGSRPPNLAAHSAPSSRSGAAAITASSVVPARTPDGADGCAPIHSSASGPGAGTGRPCSSAIAVRVPHG